MNEHENKLKELQSILTKFSRYIRAHILEFNLQKSGIDPDDIFQEVKIKIWKLIQHEKKIKNYPSYLRKIVYSSIIDYLRKHKREERIILSEKKKRISELKSRYDPDEANDKKLKETVGRAVDSLLESRRKVVKLFLLNMTIDEIAVFFDWSKDKTRNLLYRGLSDLKKETKRNRY